MKLKPVTLFLIVSLPTAVLSTIGIILLVLFAPFYGSYGTGILIGTLLISLILFLIDRVFVKFFSTKTTFIVEVVFIILIILFLLYKSKNETIFVETSNPYFIILESADGIDRDDLQRGWLFDEQITVKTNELIEIKPDFLKTETLKIESPKNWSGQKVYYGMCATPEKSISYRAYTDTLSEEQLKKIVAQKTGLK